MMRDHPHERPCWQENTLLKEHPERPPLAPSVWTAGTNFKNYLRKKTRVSTARTEGHRFNWLATHKMLVCRPSLTTLTVRSKTVFDSSSVCVHVCVCVCVCVCVHVCVCYRNVHVLFLIYMWVSVCVYVCVWLWVCENIINKKWKKKKKKKKGGGKGWKEQMEQGKGKERTNKTKTKKWGKQEKQRQKTPSIHKNQEE